MVEVYAPRYARELDRRCLALSSRMQQDRPEQRPQTTSSTHLSGPLMGTSHGTQDHGSGEASMLCPFLFD